MTGNTGNATLRAGALQGLWQTFAFQVSTLCLALSLTYSATMKEMDLLPAPRQQDDMPVIAALSPQNSITPDGIPLVLPGTLVPPAQNDKSDLATMEELADPPVQKKKPVPKFIKRLPLDPALYQATSQTLAGMASWYGPGFHGRRSADGSRFDQHALTAAHKTLPFGTVVRVTNTRTGKSCLVRITDRGPYAHGRIIDLSMAAADAIGMKGSGVARVKVEVLSPRDTQTAEQPHAVANVES